MQVLNWESLKAAVWFWAAAAQGLQLELHSIPSPFRNWEDGDAGIELSKLLINLVVQLDDQVVVRLVNQNVVQLAVQVQLEVQFAVQLVVQQVFQHFVYLVVTYLMTYLILTVNKHNKHFNF